MFKVPGYNASENLKTWLYNSLDACEDELSKERIDVEKRAERYKCQNKDIYHCLLLKDKTRLKEVCIKQARIGKGE